jgi:hypothetical protein
MKYRPQRGGYTESMADMIHVDGLRDLANYLGVQQDDIQIVRYGTRPDSRNGWHTHTVLVSNQCVGFTDGL